MTREFGRSEWSTFFNELSRDLADWETMVHVLNDDSGAQILSKGLPFNGLISEERGGRNVIELLIGAGTADHQTHNIFDATKVAFSARGRGPAGTLDIEDASGTTTLVTFIQPRRALIEVGGTEMVSVM
jgi:hypothetical protein